MEPNLLIDLGLIVVAATLFGYIARLFKQPSLLAYIIAGLVIGPFGLGAMGIGFQGMQIGISKMEDIRIFAELGVAFLLFSVGVETDFRKLLNIGRVAALGATLQVVATIAVVAFFSKLFPIISFEQSIYLGVILAFSSTMVVIKLLGENYQINTLHGRLLIGFLIIQDCLVILAIPLLNNLNNAFSADFFASVLLRSVVMIAAAVVISRHLLPRLFKFSMRYQEEFYLAAVSSCFIFIALAMMMQFPIAIGAFIGGLALSTLPYNTEIFNKIRGLRDFFVIIFFVALGMQLSPSFAGVPLALIAFIVVMVFIVKPLFYYLITLFSGFGNKVSIMVALGLANVSEFSFIIASQGYNPLSPETSVLSPELFSATILIIALSMVIAPYLMNSYARIYSLLDPFVKKLPKGLKRKRFSSKLDSLQNMPEKMQDHIIIIGAGTMGFAIAKGLYKHHEVVVIDQDSEVVYSCIRQNMHALYGEADNIELLRKLNPKKAKMVVIAIPNVKASLAALSFLKSQNKKILIFARAHYYSDALQLYGRGADMVCMPQVIGSNLFLKSIGQFLNTGNLSEITNLHDEYMHYLEEKVKEERAHFGFYRSGF